MALRRSFSVASRPTKNSSFCAPIQTTSSARHEITKLASCCQNSCRHLCVKSIASRSSLLIMFSLPPLTRGCLIDIGIEGHTASKLFYMKKHSEASPFAHFTSESLFAQTANQMAEFSALALHASCEREIFFGHSLNRRIGHHAALLSASIRPVTRSCKKQFSATSGFSAASPASGCRGEPPKHCSASLSHAKWRPAARGVTARGRKKTGQFSEEPPCCN